MIFDLLYLYLLYLGNKIYPLWPIDGVCKRSTAPNLSTEDREDNMPGERTEIAARG